MGVGLERGDIVRTNYGTGPYRICHITRGCVCSSYVDCINNMEKPSKPHVHLMVRSLDPIGSKMPSYLNGYDEGTLRSVWNDTDELIVLPPDRPIQTSLF